MGSRFSREFGLIIAWLVFPIVPVVLEGTHYEVSNLNIFSRAQYGPEPRDWHWQTWLLVLGPLVGYGFLAGATIDLPDDVGTNRGRWRRLLSRRSVWVAVGPWCGACLLAALFGLFYVCASMVDRFATPSSPAPGPVSVSPEPVAPAESWFVSALAWAAWACFLVVWSYGWLWPGWAALRRAASLGRLSRAFYRGLSVALAFVGSLFGSFWVATSLWRGYFFDPRFMPLLLVAAGLLMTTGCTSDITYGEVRRRELFHAMLVAWTLGLAVMWRWWSRRPGDTKPNSGQ